MKVEPTYKPTLRDEKHRRKMHDLINRTNPDRHKKDDTFQKMIEEAGKK